jgi:hypothetical protein
MMEIPAGKWCEETFGRGHELGYRACPFYSCDDGNEVCAVFEVNLYAERCSRCFSAYPNGAVVRVEARGAK